MFFDRSCHIGYDIIWYVTCNLWHIIYDNIIIMTNTVYSIIYDIDILWFDLNLYHFLIWNMTWYYMIWYTVYDIADEIRYNIIYTTLDYVLI